MTIDNIPELLNWRDLRDFVRYLPLESALSSETKVKEADFAKEFNQSAMLASIYDAIQNLGYMYAKVNSKSEPTKPKLYPRPFKIEDGSGSKKYGNKPVPISEFDEWWSSFDDNKGKDKSNNKENEKSGKNKNKNK